MLYLFVGEQYFRNDLINKWKKAFEEKYSDLNIFHIKKYDDFDLNYYSQNLFGVGLFSQKTLFIIDEVPFGVGLNDNESKFVDFFIENASKVDSENILIFNNNSVDKRSKLYKEIKKVGEIKDFSLSSNDELFSKLKTLFDQKISPTNLQKLIDLKGQNFNNIVNEINKVLITKDKFADTDLENISRETSENIFEIINLFLDLNIKDSVKKLIDLSDFLDNPYLLYNSLVANFRIYFYIFSLKDKKVTNNEITKYLQLGNRGFLVNKRFKIESIDFYNFYYKLLQIDSKMKTGSLIGNSSKEFLYELKNIFITYNK